MPGNLFFRWLLPTIGIDLNWSGTSASCLYTGQRTEEMLC